MRSTKHAKHAKPSFHPTRTTLSTGLTAALLPLCMASPALADSSPGAGTGTSASSTTDPGTTSGSSTTTAPAKKETVTRLVVPSGTVKPGKHVLWTRVMQADGNPAQSAYVKIEKYVSGTGWVYLGRVITDSNGVAKPVLSFSKTTTLRAVYQGSSTRAASTSSNVAIRVMTPRQRALQVAAAQKGDPYRYGAVGPTAFDCSGLMLYSYKAVGKSLPHSSRDQYRQTTHVSQSSKQIGDLIFFHTSGGSITHVGMYAGNGNMWAAPHTGDVVKLQKIYSSSYYVGRVNV
jgi:cell wall-associated NlpC family hydrolase